MTDEQGVVPEAGSPPPRRSTARRVRRLLRDGTAVMLGGTLAATVLAYLFQLLGARVLGPVAFAPLTVLWSIQFLVTTVVMVPVEQLVIRRMVLTKGFQSGLRAPSVTILLVLAAVAAWVSAMVVPDFAGDLAWAVLAVALVVTYTVFAAARGVTAGRRDYRRYGGATAAEALVRLVLAGGVLLVTQSPVALGVVMVLAPLGVLLVQPFTATVTARVAAFRSTRQSEEEGVPLTEEPSVEVVVGRAGRFLWPLVVANGACQSLLGGGPLLLAALGTPPTVLTSTFLTFTIFRGPLWVIQSALARVLPPFTRSAHDVGAMRRRAAGLGVFGLVLGAVALPVGWWLGPGLIGILFGQDVAPSAAVAGLVACGTAVSGVTLFAGQVLVARGVTTVLATAWCIALLGAVGLLWYFGGEPATRVSLAFCLGEVVALVLTTGFALAVLGRAGRSEVGDGPG